MNIRIPEVFQPEENSSVARKSTPASKRRPMKTQSKRQCKVSNSRADVRCTFKHRSRANGLSHRFLFSPGQHMGRIMP